MTAQASPTHLRRLPSDTLDSLDGRSNPLPLCLSHRQGSRVSAPQVSGRKRFVGVRSDHCIPTSTDTANLVYRPGRLDHRWYQFCSRHDYPFMSSLSLAKFAAAVSAVRAAPVPGTRAIANSASSGKALPFSLRGLRNGVDERNNDQVLRMLVFGKPGAGKGTLSSRLVKKYDILSISTGDLLRQHIAEGLVHHYFSASNAPLTYLQDPSWPPGWGDRSTRRTCS